MPRCGNSLLTVRTRSDSEFAQFGSRAGKACPVGGPGRAKCELSRPVRQSLIDQPDRGGEVAGCLIALGIVVLLRIIASRN